jgi:hypothetical protein
MTIRRWGVVDKLPDRRRIAAASRVVLLAASGARIVPRGER